MNHLGHIFWRPLSTWVVAAAFIGFGQPVQAAEGRFSPDAPPNAIAGLHLRCHVSVTCPLRSKDYALYSRAMAGDHIAEAEFARKLDRGEGMPVDQDAAVSWYGRAAEGGSIHAALELNRLFRAGAAIHADDPRIVASLRGAVAAGEPDAMRALADMEFYGRGTARDTRGALDLLRRAASSGSPAATADLARLQGVKGPAGRS